LPTTSAQLANQDRLEIVLVSPRNPLNIGAAARAMANFGFSRLAVVRPALA
jgi:tRNA/rRNA methyltransferase